MIRTAAIVSILCIMLVGCNGKPQPPAREQDTAKTPTEASADFKGVESEGRDEATGLWREIEHVKSGVRLRLIPAGEFDMGSPETEQGRLTDEGPVRRVRIREPFYMGKTEVTQAQWKAIMGAKNNPSLWRGDGLPVEQVSWEDAGSFCAKAGEGLRLPTEAEWEYACRAGTTTQWYFGDDAGALGDYAWYSENSGGRTNEVGKKKPNAWGLYDMYGNVSEWCEDTYHDSYNGAPDNGAAWLDGEGKFRVFRGGSWDASLFAADTIAVRSAGRDQSIPALPDLTVGFRVVAPADAGK